MDDSDADPPPTRDGEFDLALCQYEFDADVASIDDLLTRVRTLFDRAGEADLSVLPELFAADCLDDGGEAIATLGPEGRERLHAFLAEAAAERDAVVVGGSYNVTEAGATYNRCPIAAPDGGVETYDKTRLIPGEREDGKTAGGGAPPIVDHRGVGVGVAVCYDVEFPGLIRNLADRGAEVLSVPSWTASDAGSQRVRRCAAARAVENQLYAARVSVVGTTGGDATGTGRSAVFAPCDDVVGPHGTRLSLARDAHAAGVCGVDIEALRESRRAAAVRPYADASDGRDALR
jgi:predicted amidohydrolase